MAPTYGGQPIFGQSVSVAHVPSANAAQLAAFFGVDNVQSLMGGRRGRVFEIRGCFVGITPAACVAAEQALLSYADGIARTLVDTTGTPWFNVVFKAEYSREGQFMKNASPSGGWLLPYRALFIGLS